MYIIFVCQLIKVNFMNEADESREFLLQILKIVFIRNTKIFVSFHWPGA
jgi:hypothetical protein